MKAAQLDSNVKNAKVRRIAKSLATRLTRRNGKRHLEDAPQRSTRGWVS